MRKYLERRKEVLELLYEHSDSYISGQEVSKQLQVSRTTIWKYIKYFREAGYKIESSSRLGYKLQAAPDILLPEEIKRDLATNLIGTDILHYDRLASTNELAKEKAKTDLNSGTVLIAEEQTGGKGRLGKSFYSPQGGIWASILLRPDLKPVLASRATYLVSLAIAETITENLGLSVKIKWPNDVLVQGKKVSGILTEMGAEIDQINYLIVGMGINANFTLEQIPEDLHSKVITMRSELGEKINRVAFVQNLLTRLEKLYPLLQQFNELKDRWKDYSVTLGQEVKVLDGKSSYHGRAIKIADDGALVIETGGQKEKVYSGEVSLAYD